MTGWTEHSGKAIGFGQESIDTDQLIPARFMSTPRSEGYGRFLLHDLRHAPDGTLNPDIPFNRHPDATILVAGRNFGSGSSREAAVYALLDFGIRAVVAPSFGDIFAANAVNNGLLPARVAPRVGEQLLARLGDQKLEASIDLASLTLTVAEESMGFQLDGVWREKLIKGWDDIDLTQAHRAEIKAYRAGLIGSRPWVFPSAEPLV